MADYRAIAAVSEAVIGLLQARYLESPEYFNNELEFKIYLAKDFAHPISAGVSLFLFRIYPNGVLRSPRGRPGPEGQQYRNQLPLDVHFILTAWAQDASLQHLIAGWMMRMIEDTPTLPPGLLNHKYPDLFRADEGVVVTPAELSTEELLRMWEVLVSNSYQISVPYVARYVKIESKLPIETGRPIQERTIDAAAPGAGA
jgi:Pvc16 N-terminal domain